MRSGWIPGGALAAVAALFLAACSAGEDADVVQDERRVVVLDPVPAEPPGVTARRGVEVGPAEAAPEIVILPEEAPERARRIVYQTVVEERETPPIPAPEGRDADLLGGGAALPAPSPGGSAEAEIVLPAERTHVAITATSTISTDENQVGDPVTAEVSSDVVVDGEVVIPAGSKVEGRVTAIERGEYPLRRPSIEIVFDRVETPDGREIPIDARAAGEVGTVVQHPRGDHARMRNVLLGAGIGAAAGGAAGGTRGAVLGGIAGGAIGAGVGSGGVDWCAAVHPGDPLIIIFNRDAVLPRLPLDFGSMGG